MKKTALFTALVVLFVAFSAPGYAAKDYDLKPTFLEIHKFVVDQNEHLSGQLEYMMSLLGQAGTYNQVQEIKKAIQSLLKDSRKNINLAGEILKKEKLDDKDAVIFIDRLTLPLATIAIVTEAYGIILSKEKKKIEKILEKMRKQKDNKSA